MPTTSITPYLFFGGRCEEAIAFYQSALGAEVVMRMRYSDSPVPAQPGQLPEGFENKIMHATLRIGEAILQVSDGNQARMNFDGFHLSLSLPTEEAVRSAFAALVEGGAVQMPVEKTFWSPCFGMLADKFGVEWMVGVVAEEAS